MDCLLRRYTIFGVSLLFITLGIGIITKGSLGTSPITSIPYSMSMVFPQLTLGEFTILFSILLIIFQWILLGPKVIDRTTKVNLLLEILISFIFGYLVDFAMWLFAFLNPGEYWMQIVCVFVGVFTLALGVYLQVVANVVMLPGDGFVYALTMKVRRNYGKVRVTSDTTMVIIAAVIGLLGIGTLGGVREGTFISCFLTGFVARLYMSKLSRLTSILIPGEDLNNISGAEKDASRCRHFDAVAHVAHSRP